MIDSWPAATVPELFCGEDTVQEATPILTFLRKQVRHKAGQWSSLMFDGCICCNNIYCCVFQRFNADYELTAREGADTMAYIALIEEKLRPAMVGLLSFIAWWCFNVVILRHISAFHSCTLSGWMQKTTSTWRGLGLPHTRLSHLTLWSLVATPTPPPLASFWPKERRPYRESLRWRQR